MNQGDKFSDAFREKERELFDNEFWRYRLKAYLKEKLQNYQKLSEQKGLMDNNRKIYYTEILRAMDYPVGNIIEKEYQDFFVRFIYERHDLGHNPDVLPVNADALLVEKVRNFVKEGRYPTVVDYLLGEQRYPSFFSVIKKAKAVSMPIYFIDVKTDDAYFANIMKYKTTNILFELATIIATAGVSQKLLLRFFTKKMSRRDLLKYGGAIGALGFLTWLMNPINFAIKQGDGEMRLRKEWQQFLVERFGLGNLGITFRNVVWAQKLKLVEKINRDDKKRKQKYVFKLGLRHFALEEILSLDDEVRLKIIERFSHELDIKNPEKDVALISRCVYDPKYKMWKQKDFIDNRIVEAVRKGRK